MAFSRRTWEQARLFYENGVSPKLICRNLKVTPSQICRHAQSENWVKPATFDKRTIPNELLEPFEEVEHAIEDAIEEKKLSKNELRKGERYLIHSKACQAQLEILDLIIEARRAMAAFVIDNPRGTYIKKDGEKDTIYGLVSEALSPLSSLLNATSIFTHDKRGINVTNNTQINQNPDSLPQPTISIEIVGK